MIGMKEVRNRLKMSQQDFSNLVGMTQQAVSRIEKNRNETLIHKQLLKAIVILQKNGLLKELMK